MREMCVNSENMHISHTNTTFLQLFQYIYTIFQEHKKYRGKNAIATTNIKRLQTKSKKYTIIPYLKSTATALLLLNGQHKSFITTLITSDLSNRRAIQFQSQLSDYDKLIVQKCLSYQISSIQSYPVWIEQTGECRIELLPFANNYNYHSYGHSHYGYTRLHTQRT